MTSSPITAPTRPHGWRYGTVLFAGTVLLIVGILEFLRGLSALFDNTLYVNTPRYIFAFDVTAWGWIHLVWGIVLVVIGGLILAERPIGRILGLVPVSISMVLNFASLPVYPLWSIVLLTLDALVIWALCTAGFADDVTY
ncbi:hypothetical protein [Terrabacter sp. Ter38]|uniref:DUF7144 family membrane protein n=1 Tax=Terrabacter sp. Ter38 TaxID=2926030 RepID=UPI00211731EB|nr:hypothetical protein [Terrabacter sp. Ter38]